MAALSPRSALDVVSDAFAHTKQQVWPFEWAQWWRLALLGFVTTEVSNLGCNNVGSFLPSPPSPAYPPSPAAWPTPPWGASLVMVLLGAVLLVLAIVVLSTLFLYVNSICRFVLIETVATRRCGGLRSGWRKWRAVGRRYFLFQIAFQAIALVSFLLVIGLPLAVAASTGVFSRVNDHVGLTILGGIVLLGGVLALAAVMLTMHVIAKDFVAPILAIEQDGVLAAWGRVWSLIRQDKWGVAGYLLVKFVMSIGAAIAVSVVLLILLGPMMLAGAMASRGGGIVWTPTSVVAILVAGAGGLAWLSACLAFANAPFAVFFPAYGMYFLASRYPPLDAWLHPVPRYSLDTPAGTDT